MILNWRSVYYENSTMSFAIMDILFMKQKLVYSTEFSRSSNDETTGIFYIRHFQEFI